MSRSPLYRNLEKLGMVERNYLTDEEAELYKHLSDDGLPEDVYTEIDAKNKRRYWRYPALPFDEINTRLTVFNAINIQTIKNCAVFFAVLAVISILLAILGMTR